MLRNPSNDFTVNIVYFGTAKLTRNTIKSKFIYNDWGITFDGDGELLVITLLGML